MIICEPKLVREQQHIVLSFNKNCKENLLKETYIGMAE